MRQISKSATLPRDVLNHWGVAVPVLLVVAALSLVQIDLYPPTADEFTSMVHAGWLVNSPYSPLDVISSVHEFSPNHTPGYFILMSIWGNLISNDLAIGRILGIFCGLLAIVMSYRLARDFIAPVAGIFVIIILSSNAFVSFYFAHVRMYAALLFAAGVVLWLYLRLISQVKVIRRSDCLALGCAVFVFLNMHVSSAVFLLHLALYHLFFARPGRRWLALTITVAVPSLLSAPWFYIIATRGIDLASTNWSAEATGIGDTLHAWLTLLTNGQPLLLALAAAGLAQAAIAKRSVPKPIIQLAVIHFLLVAILIEIVPYITPSDLRILLPSFLIFSLLMAAGMVKLYRSRSLFGVLLALWVAAGLSFHSSADWKPFIRGRSQMNSGPPWQLISRMAADTQPPPLVLANWWHSWDLRYEGRHPYTQKKHYFDRRNLRIATFEDSDQEKTFLRSNATSLPRVWVLYRGKDLSPEQLGDMNLAMQGLEYDFCRAIQVGVSWTIMDYSWKVMKCQNIEQKSYSRASLIDYRFYDARLSADGSRLYIAGAWSALADFARDRFSMSYQLISAEWANVAQLDLPLAQEGGMRPLSIDISHVPPGAYRLMLILYDKHSSNRIDWIDNPGYVPSMLELTEVITYE